jgi:RNA polymerase sigma-70 factor (ECF subfamily)
MNESFTRFYRAHKDRLFGYLIRKTGNYDLSCDIVQESFTRLLRVYGRNEQKPALLYTIARNALLDHFRKSKRNEPLDFEQTDVSLDPEKRFIVQETYRKVLSAFQRLDEEEKDVLSLAVSGDFSYREIGKIAGISEGSVKVKIHRARVKLKAELGSLRTQLE